MKDKLFLPEGFNERSFDKAEYPFLVGWNSWCEELWRNGIETRGLLNREVGALWSCDVCHTEEKEIIENLRILVNHANTKKHRENLQLAKLGGEQIYGGTGK